MKIDYEKEELAAEIKGSFLRFCQYFYPLLTSRDFIISNPSGREPHAITICKALTRAFRLEVPNHRLLISVPPGHGKSTMLLMWVAWTMAHYPDSKFLYISYSVSLAAKHTETIKRIIQLPHYRYLFDISIRHDARGKEFFQTTNGGSVSAFGSSGSIVGTDGGLPGLDRFTGGIILDDLHKIDEAHSDTIRQSVITNYRETIQQRARGIKVPFIYIGQRVHEDDLAAYLLAGKDGYQWEHVILKSIDDAGNALYPEAFPLEMLRIKQETDPYVFSSQMQQEPVPSGGSLFKPEWFELLEFEPKIIATFITADTAETQHTYNDASAFSFWGIYEIETMGRKTGEYGLHWLDASEIFVEPKDLKDAFMDFWQSCMRHPTPPLLAAIEKKSTGTTLVSILKDVRGIQIRNIERNRSSGSKTQRFLEVQPYVASRLISLTNYARHTDLCINHMSKITANDSHKRDDLCFIKGTKIATIYGYKNIEDITIKDKIITPFGIGKILACGSLGVKKVINKINLTGTENHPIFNNTKFERLDTIADDATINKLSLNELLKWKYKKRLLLMELNIDSWGRESITLANQQNLKSEKILKDCMLQFGSFIANRKYKKALSFITKTTIHLIITTIIWNVFQGINILKTMKSTALDGLEAKKENNILKRLINWLKNGINPKKVESGIAITHAQVFCENHCINAKYATMNSQVLNAQNIVQSPAITYRKQQEQEKSEHEKEVYNLTVSEYGVYYANNILVSNCDTLADAIKIALIDKTIITTKLNQTDYNSLAKNLYSSDNKTNRLRNNAYR